MLETIRQRASGWIATVFIVLMSFSVAFWGIQHYFHGRGDAQRVAKVGSTPISAHQLQWQARRMQSQLVKKIPAATLYSKQMQQHLRQRALDDLIMMTAQHEALTESGYRTAPQLVSKRLQSMPALQHKHQFSPELYHRLLSRVGMSEMKFLESMGSDLAVGQLYRGIVQSSFILPNEVSRELYLLDERRDIGFLTLDSQASANHLKNTTLTEAQIKRFYQKHRQQYRQEEQVKLGYVVLSRAQIRSSLKPTENELKAFYATHFSGKQPYAKIKAEVKEKWLSAEVSKRFEKQKERLSDLAYSESESLKPIALAMNTKIQQSGWLSRRGLSKGLLSQPQVIHAAFNKDVAQNGLNSEVLKLKNGDVVVLRRESYRPPAFKPLQAVRPQVIQALRNNLVKTHNLLLAKRLSMAIYRGEDPQKLAKDNGVKWTRVSVDRYNKTKQSPTLVSATFKARGPIVWQTLPNGDVAVVKVYASHPGKIAAAPKSRRIKVAAALRRSWAATDYSLHKQQWLSQARVKVFTKHV